VLKKAEIPRSKRTSLVQKCGDCLHFETVAKFEKVCSKLGTKRFADAPSCYSANVFMLTKKNPDRLHQIGLMFHDFTFQEKRILMSLFKSEKIFEKKYKLTFGQPVYFYLARDYLSNYFRGFFVGAASNGDSTVYVASDLSGRQRTNPCTASLFRTSVFSVSEFKKKKAVLIKAHRITDPNPLAKEFKRTPPAPADKYQPPSMETAPSKWFDQYDKRLESGKKLKRQADGSILFKVEK
jgi:hypothetical protein